MERAKVLLLGAGALGVFFTSKLAAAGAETVVAARSDYDAVRTRGYEIDDRGTVSRFVPDQVIRSAAECPFSPDYVIVAAKVLPEIRPEILTAGLPLSDPTAIVLIQNGIGIEGPFADCFPKHEILSAVAYLCASRPESGKVVNTGPGKLEMGSYPAGIPSPAAKRLAELFTAGGAPCRLLDNVQTARWRKLLWNVPFNPVSVLAGGAETLPRPDGRSHCRRGIRGYCHCAGGSGRNDGLHPFTDPIQQQHAAGLSGGSSAGSRGDFGQYFTDCPEKRRFRPENGNLLRPARIH